MKIKTLMKLKKNYQIVFENGEKLIVDEDTIVNNKLLPGMDVDNISLIKKEVEKNKLYDKAIRFASYGKSENQMIKYLNEHGMQNTYEMIQRLKRDKVINDWQLIAYLKRQGYSYQKLLSKLQHYELDSEQIDKALEDYDESYALKKAFAVALKKYANEQYPKKNEKIYRNLVSQGFSEEKVQSLMRI
ncbi:RecX family transcriptional regulator [Acholeplasma equirhinis]|uniref:RecX family transcriptional regulator n=1 Tax=Acholeplasma equirhinis TaxID=555393 RepID=UPI00197A7A25|nr:RecX family transcriptional regulator [Acholeplasma equirhinis]MBN3490679.1 RecX family transcriptional regulator [Acholeplasma equirhinis]